MEAIIKRKASVWNYDNILLQAKKNNERSKMEKKTASKIIRTGILMSFLIIIALAVILFFTNSLLIIKTLIIIGCIFLLACLAVLVLKYTGFYKSLHFSNPIDLRATDVAIAFGVVGAFSLLIPFTYGMLFVPEFMSRLQAFMSNEQESMAKVLKILGGLEEKFLTPPAQ